MREKIRKTKAFYILFFSTISEFGRGDEGRLATRG